MEILKAIGKILLLIAITYFLVWLSNLLKVFDTSPDLILISVLLISLFIGESKGVTIGFLAGLVKDFVSITPIGFFSLIYTIVGFSTYLYKRYIYTSGVFSFPLMVLLSTLLKYLIVLILSLTLVPSSLSSIWLKILVETVYNTVISIPLHWLFRNFILPLLKVEQL